MGQYWLVTCPAQREYTQHLFGMKLGELLFSSWPAYLIIFLIEPSPRSAQRDRTTGNGGLRSYEVLERINKHGGVQKPKVSAKEPTSPSKHSAFGHWIGKRIICVGDYLDIEDLPSAHQHGMDSKLDNDDPNMLHTPLYELASKDYTYIPDLFMLGHANTRPKKTTYHLAKVAIQPSNRILRNLTTKQYIREEALSSGITLGHILLLRICWSSDSSTSIVGGDYLIHGKWASHRFDIIPACALEELEQTGWKDETQSALDEVDDLWTNVHREDWQNTWQ